MTENGAVKVLIIKLSALGDVILATPFVKTIQRQHAGAEIHLMTTPPYAGMFEDWPGLQVDVFRRNGFFAFWRAVLWMRRQRFDVCYELQANGRTGWMLRLCRIPRVVSSRIGFPATHHPLLPYRREVHIFDRLNEVMLAAGLPAAEPRPWLPVSRAGSEKVQAWLAKHQLSGQRFVLMHAHASVRWQSKIWPHFGRLAEALEARGYRVVWAGAGSDAEGNRVLSRTAGIDATNQFSINELVELARHSRFALTNDSGPMHVFSCSGIPVYAFFGPTKWTQSHALGQQGRVLTHPVECSPCFLPQCPPARGHACLALLSAEQVMARLVGDGMVEAG
ncbi:ADP-heptose--LPS heptosyltransferase 2 [mine drainage metagenome]|uniref:ADP-heptose--LPS heptosyltransferase 2 n=1 Tax=mine drainage metagenome TaxID=410659 RepID=A0A1J5QTJ7_9ZZZZ